MALQSPIELLLQRSHLLKFIQVVAEIVAGGHPSQVLGRMLNAVMMARRPQQRFIEGLELMFPLHRYLQMGFQAL